MCFNARHFWCLHQEVTITLRKCPGEISENFPVAPEEDCDITLG
jgi:hypothetical protein